VKRNAWQYIALCVILLVAALFRFYGLAWDSGYLFHPDERKILMVVADLRLPANVPKFFSSESPLNPKFFAYGSFPIYLLKALSAFAPATTHVVPWREDLVGLALLGRALSALFDLGTIVCVFLLARQLYDQVVGLMAAACIAVTVLHVQLSHFYTVDTLLTLLVVVTMFFAARYAQMGKRADAVAMALAFGLALATKVTALPLVVPVVVAVAQSSRGAGAQGGRGETHPCTSAPLLLVKRWLAQIWDTRHTLAKITAVALAVFIVTQPYALLDPIRYFGQIGTESLVARGWLDYPYTRQYADTLPFVYPIAQSSVWGMSLPLGIFAWGGSAVFLWRWWDRRDWRDGFIVSWALVYFLLVGGQYAKYPRYLLPLLPFLFLMASAWLRSQTSRNTQHATRFTFHGSRLTLYASLFLAFVYSLTFVSIYSREHPWLQISRWMYANIPPGATIATEHWDDTLPVPIRSAGIERAPTEYHWQTLPMYDADDAAKLETLVRVLGSSDYIVLATERLSATITRLPARYPMSSRYYRLLFDGQLGFEPVASARNDIALDRLTLADARARDLVPPRGAWVWNWGAADESFTVYDHPLPLVFKKTRGLPDSDLRALLTPR
jgi:hypothetical protein